MQTTIERTRSHGFLLSSLLIGASLSTSVIAQTGVEAGAVEQGSDDNAGADADSDVVGADTGIVGDVVGGGIELTAEEMAALEAEESAFKPNEALKTYSSVTSKLVESTMTAAASVYVLTREQLTTGGYRSIAEALAQVPGIFVSYDLINYHVAMRGAFGGTRGGARMLKVMIDGVPVPQSFSETYLMGPEFIPMSVVERIEVMRGPASSLYGGGALVGAINVVTRREAYDGQTRVHGDVRGMVGAPGVLAGATDMSFSIVGEGYYLLGGLSIGAEDRSGRSLAGTSVADTSQDGFIPFVSPYTPSPFLSRYAQKAEDGTILVDSDGNPLARSSESDYAFPASLFLKGEANLFGGVFRSIGVAQLQIRNAEFHDLAVLTGGNQVRALNTRLMLSYERPLPLGLSASGRLVFGGTGNLPGDQIRFSNVDVSKQAGSANVEAIAELRYSFANDGFIQGGVNALYDFEKLPRYAEIDPETGEEIRETKDLGIAHIGSGALFLNAGYTLLPWLKLAGGVRADLYGAAHIADAQEDESVSWPAGAARAGTVVFLSDRMAWKSFVGASYKAPSPEQLFSARTTADSRDFDGDLNVRPQYLFGGETSYDVFPVEWLSLSVAGYYNYYLNALSYTATGGVLRPTNYNAHNIGAEAIVQANYDLSGVTVYGGSTLSLQYTLVVPNVIASVEEQVLPDNEGVPIPVLNTNVGFIAPSIFTRLNLSYRYVGPRTPTQSNLIELGGVDLSSPRYVLTDYHKIDMMLSSTPIPLGGPFNLEVSLRLTNLLGLLLPYGATSGLAASEWDYNQWVPARPYSEVGFNGVDIPAEGLTAWGQLRLTF